MAKTTKPRKSVKAARDAVMSPEGFRDWMILYRLSISQAARVLGCHERQISNYRDGTTPIARTVAMAVWAHSHGYPPP